MGSIYVSNISLDATETTKIGIKKPDDGVTIRVAGNNKIDLTWNTFTHNVSSLNVSSLVVGAELTMPGANTNILNIIGGAPSISGDVSLVNASVEGSTINVASLTINSNTWSPGAWTVLNSATFSGVTSFIIPNLSNYRHLRLTFSGMTMGNNNNCYIQIGFGSNTTSPLSNATYGYRAWGSITPGNAGITQIARTANTRILLSDRVGTSYAAAISNSSAHGGLDGHIVISSFGEAQKTKVYGSHIFEDHTGTIQIALMSAFQQDRIAMNSIFISANTVSGAVGTFSGTITTEGLT